jgi:hypothetical protein
MGSSSSSSAAAANANVGNDAINMISSSISAFAKEGIDSINKGETFVSFAHWCVYVVLFVVREEEIIIISLINDNDAAMIADVLKTNTTLQALGFVLFIPFHLLIILKVHSNSEENVDLNATKLQILVQ